MVSKLVQFSDQAYRRLSMMKRKGESFSDVVLRLTRPAGLQGLRGLRTPAQVAEAKRWMRKIDRMDRPKV